MPNSIPRSLLQEACDGLKPYSYNCVINSGQVNGSIICKYVIAVRAETGNQSDNYRKSLITILGLLSQFHKNKPFKSMKQQDVIAFLNQYRKPDAKNTLHHWVGTYNLYLTHLISFFKWLYYPNDTLRDRPKPDVVKNIGRPKRREISVYNASDLWSLDDDELFMKHCTNNRLKCYHAISRDTSARPDELVNLKIRDIKFRQNADKTQFVEIPVTGKTGNRFLPLFNSIPNVKHWLANCHPCPNNMDTPFLCQDSGKGIASNQPRRDYANQKQHFIKLLNSPNVSDEDKAKIKLLLAKPWHAYIRRHTGITEKAANPDIAAVLESHAGWVEGSGMKKRYVHLLSNKANNTILQAYGVLPKDTKELKLRVKQCPQCQEPNTPDAKFCAKCRMVLRYDGYQESVEKQKENEAKIQALEAQVKELASNYNVFAQVVNLDFDKVVTLVQSGKYKNVSEEEFTNTNVGGIKFEGRQILPDGKHLVKDRIFLAPAPLPIKPTPAREHSNPGK